MNVFDVVHDQGETIAVEIGNCMITRAQIVEFIGSLPDTEVVRDSTAIHGNWDAVFCEFAIQGQLIHGWEPLGDNSRYWIKLEPSEPCPQAALAREAFKTDAPSYLPILGLMRRLKSWLRFFDSLRLFARSIGLWVESLPASSRRSRSGEGTATLPSVL